MIYAATGGRYFIDSLVGIVDAVSAIEGVKPSFFQRDGSLWLASKNCFGQASIGLPTRECEARSPVEEQSLVFSRQVALNQDGLPPKKTKERPIIEAITYPRPFGNYFDSKHLSEISERLSELEVDGDIMLVSTEHEDDGRAIVIGARRMNLEHYLALMRLHERELIGEVLELPKEARDYRGVEIPRFVFRSPYNTISFPRAGVEERRMGAQPWGSGTNLAQNLHIGGSILEYRDLTPSEDNPFSTHCVTNLQETFCGGSNGYDFTHAGKLKAAAKEFDVIRANLDDVNYVVCRMNDRHREVFPRRK